MAYRIVAKYIILGKILAKAIRKLLSLSEDLKFRKTQAAFRRGKKLY